MPISWSIYATWAAAFIVAIFIAIIVQMITSQYQLYKKAGISSFRLDKAIFLYFKKHKSSAEHDAYLQLKKQTARLVAMWITLLLLFVIITLLIGAFIGFK